MRVFLSGGFLLSQKERCIGVERLPSLIKQLLESFRLAETWVLFGADFSYIRKRCTGLPGFEPGSRAPEALVLSATL